MLGQATIAGGVSSASRYDLRLVGTGANFGVSATDGSAGLCQPSHDVHVDMCVLRACPGSKAYLVVFLFSVYKARKSVTR